MIFVIIAGIWQILAHAFLMLGYAFPFASRAVNVGPITCSPSITFRL